MTPFATKSPILVVEDSDEDFDTLLQMLSKSGISSKVYRALNGDDCLTQLRDHSGPIGVHPAFILMDLNCHGTDGREALREIKSDPGLKMIPVVILTTSSNPRDLNSCYELGANAYHIKPIQSPDHIRLLEEIFRYWIMHVWVPKNVYQSDQYCRQIAP